MKLGTRIRIIADRPAKGQDSIADWIGKEFEIVGFNPESKTVRVLSDGGEYVINPKEYEVIK